MQEGGPTDARTARRRDAIQWTATRGATAYRTAHRHSRLVAALRWLLPLIVVVAAGAFATTLYVESRPAQTAALPKVDMQSNSLVMDAPRVSGFSNAKRSYEVSAQKATQNLQNPKIVTLDRIEAAVGLDGAGKAMVRAATGVYDSEAETLSLKDGIRMESSAGYEADLSEAQVNLRTQSVQSSKPVEIRTNDGVIKGNAVEISDGGSRIQLSRGVSVTFGGAAKTEPAP